MNLRTQLLRYAVAGVVINAGAFIAYLVLTGTGLSPPLAMTFTYFSALALSFVVNRSITFEYQGKPSPALGRYIVAYAAGYLLNFLGLVALVRFVHIPHYWAQGGLVLLVAVSMFIIQRLWVFPENTRRRAKGLG